MKLNFLQETCRQYRVRTRRGGDEQANEKAKEGRKGVASLANLNERWWAVGGNITTLGHLSAGMAEKKSGDNFEKGSSKATDAGFLCQ